MVDLLLDWIALGRVSKAPDVKASEMQKIKRYDSYSLLFFKKTFIYLKQREQEQGREGQRKREKHTPC